ncbi:MauE/DoxX family redox-associated membrane protein [Pedosphaera parvula]|uniref:DoxX family protein n=1 Tax=Pedosphaera parvula (strain Ellin514) TaxID=320771 RepID=B9XRU2_PEDPL|nr:MauE/DoxX family redox-associated membrane protein [Pedosphaera parvula]EEF57453.1 DoxX family protein [Pedosphaera parvula Ellin514]
MKSKCYFQLALRWLFGLILLWAAFSKLGNLHNFYLSLLAYQLPLPNFALQMAAIVLPWLELFCGLHLIVGFSLRPALAWTLILFTVFLLATGQAWARGLDISCGCFNLGSSSFAKTFESVGFAFARSIVLLLGALYLFPQSGGPCKAGQNQTSATTSPSSAP